MASSNRFVNVVPEGPLANWHVSISMRTDRTLIDLPAASVRILDTQCMDFSHYFPSEIFPPDFIERNGYVTLRSPLEVTVRPSSAVILSNEANQVVTEELQLSLRLRKARATSTFDVNLSKFKLCWGRDIAAMVNQAITQVNVGPDPTYIGAVASCQALAPPPIDAGKSGGGATNMFLRWERDQPSGRSLAGQSLLIEHSGGIVWRVINVSKNKDTQIWALDSAVAYLTLEDLAGQDAHITCELTLTSDDKRSVRLGTVAEQVLSIEENPVMPSRVVRIVNASWKQLPLSFKSSSSPTGGGWQVQLSGEVHIPARESCARGEWTQPQTLQMNNTLSQSALVNSERLGVADYKSVIEIAQSGPYKWFGRRSSADSFQLIYVLYSP